MEPTFPSQTLFYANKRINFFPLRCFLSLMNLKLMDLKLINLKSMNLKLINLKSMSLKLINLKSMNLKLMNLKLVAFLVLFSPFWCLVFFLCFFVLVKSFENLVKNK